VEKGPAMTCVTSSTRTPASGSGLWEAGPDAGIFDARFDASSRVIDEAESSMA
jgi:hypothetical protein